MRFLIVVTGGWACGRGAILLWDAPADRPDRPDRLAARGAALALDPAAASAPAGEGAALRPPPQRLPDFPLAAARAAPVPRSPAGPGRSRTAAAAWRPAAPPAGIAAAEGRSDILPAQAQAQAQAPAQAYAQAPIGGAWRPAPAPPDAGPASRWSLAGFGHLRRGSGPRLAPGGGLAGSLGGSQAGARLGYRLSGGGAPLSLIARVSAPLAGAGAEGAVGIEWQPRAEVPLRIAAERRHGLDAGGRSALSVGVHGGVADVKAPAGFRLDAYGQAGLVGLRARDPFVDGQARVSRPVAMAGRLRLGAGLWGAAQPGASRLDLGPSASLRIAPARTTLFLDWRHRAAGNARPGSGPALTVWTDF